LCFRIYSRSRTSEFRYWRRWSGMCEMLKCHCPHSVSSFCLSVHRMYSYNDMIVYQDVSGCIILARKCCPPYFCRSVACRCTSSAGHGLQRYVLVPKYVGCSGHSGKRDPHHPGTKVCFPVVFGHPALRSNVTFWFRY
jgi:hypothetical protein